MLVLSRKAGEAIRIGADVQVTVLQIRGKQVKLGVIGPREVTICREQVHRRSHNRAEDHSDAPRPSCLRSPFSQLSTSGLGIYGALSARPTTATRQRLRRSRASPAVR